MELKLGNFSGVLMYLVDGDTQRVWLAKKKRSIGKGKWNGYGGSVEDGESLRHTAMRELKQKSGVSADPKDLRFVGIAFFHNILGRAQECLVEVYIFILNRWEGNPVETDEMGPPQMFPLRALPFEEMMPGDTAFLPAALCKDFDHRFAIDVHYNKDQTALVGDTRYQNLTRPIRA